MLGVWRTWIECKGLGGPQGDTQAVEASTCGDSSVWGLESSGFKFSGCGDERPIVFGCSKLGKTRQETLRAVDEQR